MPVFSPAAWVILLSAAATYVALLSAWLLAIPAQRAAIQQGNITAIEAEFSSDPLMRETQEEAIRHIKQRVTQSASAGRRLIRKGIALLVISFLMFTGAIFLQAHTDSAFRGGTEPKGPSVVPKVTPD